MKKLLSLLLFTLCLSARAQSTITAYVTITNVPTNGFQINVNGNVRTWTNVVTAANVQIADTNSIAAAVTNLLYAYALYPLNNIYVSQASMLTNTLVFQGAAGQANSISFVSNWASVTYFTSPTGTNMTAFRGFASEVGNYELTNTANGIVSYLNSTAVTNPIATNAPAMANYLTIGGYQGILAGLTNFIRTLSTNSTNFTLATSNSLWSSIVAATNGIDTAAYSNSAAFQPANANLTNWSMVTTNFVINLLASSSYLDSSGNIVLIDGNHIQRLIANKGSIWQLNYSDGNPFFYVDGFNDFQLMDHAGVNRVAYYDVSQGGSTFLQNSSGYGWTIDGANNVSRSSFAVSFDQTTLPTTAAGTVTNYYSDAQNSTTTETTADDFSIPGNTLVHNGDTFKRTVGVKCAANGNAKTVKVYFDGTLAASASTSTSGAYVYVTVAITRDTSSSFRLMSSATTGSGTGGGTSGTSYAYVNTVSGEDFTTAKDFKVTLTGTSTGDLTTVLDRVEFAPAPQ